MPNDEKKDLPVLTIRELMWTDRIHHSAIDAQVKSLGIRRNQHMLLMYLSRRKEPPTQVEIAREFNITAASVAGMLDKLEAEGLAERTDVPDDRRTKQIVITPAGRDVVSRTQVLFAKVDNAMCAGVSEEELETLRACLKKLRENLKQYDPELGDDET